LACPKDETENARLFFVFRRQLLKAKFSRVISSSRRSFPVSLSFQFASRLRQKKAGPAPSERSSSLNCFQSRPTAFSCFLSTFIPVGDSPESYRFSLEVDTREGEILDRIGSNWKHWQAIECNRRKMRSNTIVFGHLQSPSIAFDCLQLSSFTLITVDDSRGSCVFFAIFAAWKTQKLKNQSSESEVPWLTSSFS